MEETETEFPGMEFPGIRHPYERGAEDARNEKTMEPERHGYVELLHKSAYMSGWISEVTESPTE